MRISQIHVFSIKPDEEPVQSITQYCKSEHITSAVVTGIIGSLRSVKLEFLKELPGRYETEDFQGLVEIVCVQGTVGVYQDEFALHIHILVSDENHAVRGHLTSARVFSTAEVALAELDQQIKPKRLFTHWNRTEEHQLNKRM